MAGQTIKTYIVDPQEMTIDPFDYNEDEKDIFDVIECNTIDAARVHKNVQFWVDDEALIRGERPFLFMFDGYPQPIAGKALAHCVDDEGQMIAPEMDLEIAAQMIRFVEVAQLPDGSACLYDRSSGELSQIPDATKDVPADWMAPKLFKQRFGGGL